MIIDSDIGEPLNLGSSELVTINQLVDIVEEIAGVKLERSYKLDAPQGVRGRNTDNTLIQRDLRLGAVDHPGRRPGEDLRLGPRPGQALPHDGRAAADADPRPRLQRPPVPGPAEP